MLYGLLALALGIILLVWDPILSFFPGVLLTITGALLVVFRVLGRGKPLTLDLSGKRTCPQCGRRVSKATEACPLCGYA